MFGVRPLSLLINEQSSGTRRTEQEDNQIITGAYLEDDWTVKVDLPLLYRGNHVKRMGVCDTKFANNNETVSEVTKKNDFVP